MIAARLAPQRLAAAGDWRARGERLAAAGGLLALSIWLVASWPATPDALLSETVPDDRSTVVSSGSDRATRALRREHVAGAYGGVSYTHPSAVRIINPDVTDLTVSGFGWIGRPFKSPIYYGLRTQHWAPTSSIGTMVDFTHAKAIAVMDDPAQFSGRLSGQPVPPAARVGDIFRHLEFSHGHNILTLNGLFRMPLSWLRLRPYFGAGGGISLPHTEIGLRSEPSRTYEYQFAGFAGQVLAGIELPLGRASLFLEYKFTYAPYSVPLSQEPYGALLVTDLWRQFTAWRRGEKPPGGVLTTTLATHHGIGGLLVRVVPGVRAADAK